jgi:HAD superfamily hydrolase (TIGR01458 family)
MDPIPGAADTLRYLGDMGIGYRFISNGTRRGRKSVREKLSLLDIPVSEDQIITPASAAVAYLKEQGFPACTLLATRDLREDFIRGGISLTDNAPVLVIGDAGDNFTYDSVNRAFRRIMDGAMLIALEKDRYWKDGSALSLGAGAFVAGIEYASGVQAVMMGKPSSSFFIMALHSLGTRPEETLMIGDDISSDIGGARSSGIAGVLVMTGKYSREIHEGSAITPEWTIPSIASLPDLVDHF